MRIGVTDAYVIRIGAGPVVQIQQELSWCRETCCRETTVVSSLIRPNATNIGIFAAGRSIRQWRPAGNESADPE